MSSIFNPLLFFFFFVLASTVNGRLDLDPLLRGFGFSNTEGTPYGFVTIDGNTGKAIDATPPFDYKDAFSSSPGCATSLSLDKRVLYTPQYPCSSAVGASPESVCLRAVDVVSGQPIPGKEVIVQGLYAQLERKKLYTLTRLDDIHLLAVLWDGLGEAFFLQIDPRSGRSSFLANITLPGAAWYPIPCSGFVSGDDESGRHFVYGEAAARSHLVTIDLNGSELGRVKTGNVARFVQDPMHHDCVISIESSDDVPVVGGDLFRTNTTSGERTRLASLYPDDLAGGWRLQLNDFSAFTLDPSGKIVSLYAYYTTPGNAHWGYSIITLEREAPEGGSDGYAVVAQEPADAYWYGRLDWY